MRYIFLLIFVFSVNVCYSASDTTLISKITRLESKIATLKGTTDSLISIQKDLKVNDGLYIGLFERYSTRTENLISWSLALIGLLATVLGFYSFRSVYEKIKQENQRLSEQFSKEIGDISKSFEQKLLESQNEANKLKTSLTNSQYILFSYLGSIYHSQHMVMASKTKDVYSQDQYAVLAVSTKYIAYQKAPEPNKQQATSSLLASLFNLGNVVIGLDKRCTEFVDKKDYLDFVDNIYFNEMKTVLRKISKEDNKLLSERALKFLSIITNFESPITDMYPKLKPDNE